MQIFMRIEKNVNNKILRGRRRRRKSTGSRYEIHYASKFISILLLSSLYSLSCLSNIFLFTKQEEKMFCCFAHMFWKSCSIRLQ